MVVLQLGMGYLFCCKTVSQMLSRKEGNCFTMLSKEVCGVKRGWMCRMCGGGVVLV